MHKTFIRISGFLFALVLGVCATSAGADEIPVRSIQLVPMEDGGYALSADFELELSERLETALGKGVPLYFVLDFECARPRWYWLDKVVASKRLEMRLDFHALTRSYRLSAGSQRQNFASASEALKALGTVRDWQVLSANDLEPLSAYNVGVRLALDVNQLPKPFQVNALTNNDWILASAWQRWGFSTGPARKIVR